MPHPLLAVARQAIRDKLSADDRRGSAGRPAALPGHSRPQGCFVSLKIGDRLRGCIGTMRPMLGSVEEEVAANAVAAATRDPRFEPLALGELDQVRVSIDLLGPTEAIAEADGQDPNTYGLVVRAGSRVGVLLPGLPSVTTPAQQIAICRQKARIGAEEPISMERFTVLRLSE